MTRRLLAASVLLIAMFARASPPAPEAERLAERMLAAVGGRAAWANAKNTVNDSRQDWDGEPSELRVVITMDFERPRLRFDAGHVYRTLHRIAARDGGKWRAMLKRLEVNMRLDEAIFARP